MKQGLQMRTAGSHAGEKQARERADDANVTDHGVPSIGTDAASQRLKRVQRKIKNGLDFLSPRSTSVAAIAPMEVPAFNAAFLQI